MCFSSKRLNKIIRYFWQILELQHWYIAWKKYCHVESLIMSQLTLVFCRYSNVETMKSCQLYRGSTSKTQCCSTQKIRVTADLCEAHTQDTQRTCFYPGKKRNMNGILHKCIVAAVDVSSNNQIAHKCCLNHEWTNMFRFHPVFGAVAKCQSRYEHLNGTRALQEFPDSLQQAWQNMDEYQCLVLPWS